MNKCKDCKHFAPDGNSLFGGCKASAYWDCALDEQDGQSTSKAYAWDTEGYFAAVRVGCDFGCVNWGAK